ncbi:MAG TPA: acetoacetate decarboxylase family protein [Candidatus Eisenbacteria bacterium]|nr:acetoacetate decarboxylase family protein [Candidatus Eisenbacteria bacterium]
MLFGTADVGALAADAPVMERLDTEALVLPAAWVLQVTYEMPAAAREVLLPPALHPTDPPLVSWTFLRCALGPLGAFAVAQLRVECRSGLRPRGFLVAAVIDSEDAGRTLASRWGYRARPGEVRLARQYDAVTGTVRVGERTILEVALRDPDPLGAHDIQYTASMHLARTPRGPRLVQVDPTFAVERAERGRPHLVAFDAAAWGDARIAPAHPVSASIAVADVTLPKLRYLCRPDVWAFEGTESV